MKTPFSIAQILVTLAVSAASLTIGAEDSNELFTSANTAFESGDYGKAARNYERLVEDGLISSTLYYNLGTTAFRLEKPGEAVLWYRRAGLIESGAPEVTQNLEYLRTKLGFLEFAETDLDRFLRTLPPETGRWIGSVLLWGGAFALAATFCIPRLRKQRTAFLTLGIILVVSGYAALRLNQYTGEQLAPENFATVTSANTKALTAPAPGAKTVIDLPPGSEVRIIQASGPWRYVDIPGELRGWVRAEEITPVWPVPPQKS
ncbi:MAG: tetratricopeptide repeat protein [Verrucomicrobiales bacterium]|nr:tetratricopeptide repeat protein [Verrucomicrobiales bacterium]